MYVCCLKPPPSPCLAKAAHESRQIKLTYKKKKKKKS